MEKKYQVFISSTYTDLVEARKKVRDAILSMYHFPVGMELFGAANEEQWQIISETIDSSDYYVLIVGQRYGSVIPEGQPDAGISYTEKEFRYALEKGVPILAFIISDNVPVKPENIEKDHPEKLASFKETVKSGRLVEWWETNDELAQKVTVALYKQITRTKRPGWIRGDSFDVDASLNELLILNKRVRELEEENRKLKESVVQRKPSLSVYIQFAGTIEEPLEANEGYVEEVAGDDEGFKTTETVQRVHVYEKGYFTPVVRMTQEDIPEDLREVVTPDIIEDYNSKLPDKETIEEYERQMRFYYEVRKNGQLLDFVILNDGTAKATDVNITLEFPKSFFIMKRSKAEKMHEPKKPSIPSNPIDEARTQKYIAEKTGGALKQMLHLMGGSYEGVGFRNLNAYDPFSDIPAIIDGDSSVNWNVDIEGNTVKIWSKDLLHTYTQVADNLCIIPMEMGRFKIKVTMMCEEYIAPEESALEVIVET